MSRRAQVRPSKASSGMAFVVAGIFSIIGFTVVLPLCFSGPWFAGLFGLVWTMGAVAGTIIHGINLFSDRGIPTEEIHFDEGVGDRRHPPALKIEARLKNLDHLKAKGLVSAEEYQAKRAEILASL